MTQIFDGENFDKFDESKLYCQNFSFQYFAVELINLSACTCNIMAHMRMHTYRDSSVFQLGVTKT